MKRLYMRLSEKEFITLRRMRDVVIGTSSLRGTILALCNTELTRRLSFIVRTEIELRKTSVNLNQVIRKLDETGFDTDNILFVRDKLNVLIEIFTTASSCLKMSDSVSFVPRNEIAIWLKDDEKMAVSSIKRILRFKTFRTMIMSFCKIVEENSIPADVSAEYSQLCKFGAEMNKAAKALNSHTSVDLDSMIKFLVEFFNLLSKIQEKTTGDAHVR